jgi:protein-S-isoprenylcysteine O-methyltransferase Ste14
MMKDVSPRLIMLYAGREVLGLVVMAAALFWSAGRLDWWPAWAALAVMAGWTAAMAILVFLTPDLLAERLGLGKGAKRWDIAIVRIVGNVTFVRYIVAGLDQRYGWTGGFPVAVQFGALVICVVGYALFVWAVARNPFFSQIVRIQSERGHTVVSVGPYRIVRHPAYLGAILYELAVPVLLASWWCLIVSALAAGVLILRTALEDRTLQAELSGYADYSLRVRYRLLPGIW